MTRIVPALNEARFTADLAASGAHRTVATAMIHAPKTWPPATTAEEAREAFRDDHLHALLVVEGSRLLAVIERADLRQAAAATPARLLGPLHERIVSPDADLETVRRTLLASGRRRLAVVETNNHLLGMLCLKRTGLGFCSDADVRARADEQAARRARPAHTAVA
jgi:CBS-domain-containing membrane protein